jgi:activating signal cointegrator complex subunit 3
MIGRAGRPQFDDRATAVILVHEPKKGFYKKFLYEPFPVESALHEQVVDHLNAEIIGGTVKCAQDAVDYLTWTYLYRRLAQNPSFYGMEGSTDNDVACYLSALVEDSFDSLLVRLPFAAFNITNDFFL